MNLTTAARRLIASCDSGDHQVKVDAMRQYIETATFTPADEILSVLRAIAAEDWMAMPPWARNLAYRLVCLQHPADASVLREAAGDLLSFGPDWDTHARELQRQADEIDTRG